ncbi:fatty acyl-AMP ligase [Streptomyces sp. RLB1-33]|nr:fatty acyl-AMP ligase [Streptomyces sp. RLB1-33]QIY68653.1 fatty acyl-AMP ligase [Streptomyces sp. RLB1-33]
MTLNLTGHRSVGDAFAERAVAHPDRTALTVYRGSSATDHETLTFAELHRRARWHAAALGARLSPGGRVLLALPTCTEFVEYYLACLMAGLVAVPVPVAAGSANAVERTVAITRDCTPSLAITTGTERDELAQRLGDHDLGDIPAEPAGPARPGDPVPGSDHIRPPDQDTLAVLQYSSGSTGDPKGVMLGHGHILANVEAFAAGGGVGPDDVFASWLPLHHDMGLFGQLSTALLLGAPIVLMPPSDFVRRPVEWFRMLDRYGATVTAAPNFAFDLCRRLITDERLEGLDLSRVRVVFNGSEPIHVPIMTAFTKRFAAAGLHSDVVSPAYGLAEATVYVSTNRAGTPTTVMVADPRHLEATEHPELRPTSGGTGTEIVGVGHPSSLELRIVDPHNRRELRGNAIGEIWLRGSSVGHGVWNRPEATAEVFQARLADDETDATSTGWLRTGDLGAYIDGELFVTGRIKEMLIVRGRNLFPQDLEHQAREADPGLAGLVGAAFSVAAPEERIVLVHEVSPKTAAQELPAVAAAVTRHLSSVFATPVRNVVLVRRGTVRRTTSGKIQRTAMREGFLTGRLAAVLHAEVEPALRHLVTGGAA